MKIQLSFLKGILIICLSCFLSLFKCSSDVFAQTVEIQEPLTNVLKLELSFGDEETIKNNEFLLAYPQLIMVNNQNDILVFDEDRIKVFDAGGKEKHIFGRTGQGPGEYGRPSIIGGRNLSVGFFLSPQGYLIAMDSGGGTGGGNKIVGDRINISGSLYNQYNLFAPDYSFVYKKRLSNVLKLEEYFDSMNIEAPRTFYIRKLFFINEIERVYEILLKDNDPKSDIKYYTDVIFR